MKDWHKLKLELFNKQLHYRPGRNIWDGKHRYVQGQRTIKEHYPMRKFAKSIFFSFIILLTVPWSAASADEDGLYDVPLGEDAAFVRFIGFGEAQFPIAFGQSLPADLLHEGDYGVISASVTPDAKPGQYFTIVPGPDGTGLILTEPARENTAKVVLQLLNLTDTMVSLKVADGSVPIIESIATHGIGAREVNPIKVPLRVFDGETALGDAVDLILQRGNNPTFIVGPSDIIVLYSQIVRTDLTE